MLRSMSYNFCDSFQMHSNVKLQVAAIFCVCNLVWREEAGAAQRQTRLKELGLYRILLQLRHTKDTQLFDKCVDRLILVLEDGYMDCRSVINSLLFFYSRVKTALAQFFDA